MGKHNTNVKYMYVMLIIHAYLDTHGGLTKMPLS